MTTKEFDNHKQFEIEIEKLYLGPTADYKLVVSKENLPKIEKVFDNLVIKHGFKDVFFEYVFVPTEENSLAKVILPPL